MDPLGLQSAANTAKTDAEQVIDYIAKTFDGWTLTVEVPGLATPIKITLRKPQ